MAPVHIISSIHPYLYSIRSPPLPALPYLQRRLTKQRLIQDWQSAALRLLADSRALVDEGLGVCWDGGRVGAVEVRDIEDVGRATLRGAVGAAADNAGLAAHEVGGGVRGGEGEREGAEGDS
jgi:hypothetical protein